MTDLFVGPKVPLAVEKSLEGILNPTKRKKVERLEIDDLIMFASALPNTPLTGPRVFCSDRWAIVFAGDVVDYLDVPFEHITGALESADYGFLSTLNGIFVVVAYDRHTQNLHVVTDRRGQKPCFFRVLEGRIQVSTALPPFLLHDEPPAFNKKWLWECLYFNFPVSDATFLEEVKRLHPACILTFNNGSGSLDTIRYAPLFKPRQPLYDREEGLRLAVEVFRDRFPVYYEGATEVACPLTGGWDGRTVLAFAPPGKRVQSYTYGIPGCSDLCGAAATARAIGVEHMPILFDDAFVDDLPRQAFDTVYLSGGLQGVLRSTLNHAYRCLTDSGQRFPMTLSGVALDMEFRGHAQSPDLISPEVAARFRGQAVPDSWSSVLGDEYPDFIDYVQSKVETLEKEFGPADDTTHHLSYIVYPLSNSHFGGELSLADNYTTIRVPAWDIEVIELAFSISHSTLCFSQFKPGVKRGSRSEMVLQSRLFQDLAPEIYKVPVNGKLPAAILAGELPYQVYRIIGGFRQRLRGKAQQAKPPLEDWSYWLFDRNKSFVDEMLRSTDTLVLDYVSELFLDEVLREKNTRMLGKLLTSEVILRLMKNEWKPFWQQ